MEPADLARWTRFAMKGGIGRCVALCDCVAEGQDDLMFLKDDDIVVLLQVPDAEGVYLGYCEGVIGRFLGKHVQFLTRLKKPVMAKRSSLGSLSGKSPTPSGSSIGLKSPTPTFGASPTPVMPSGASLRSESRASSRYKTPQDSPIISTFTSSLQGASVSRSESFEAGRVATPIISRLQHLSGGPTSELSPQDSPGAPKPTPSSRGASISRSESLDTGRVPTPVGDHAYHSSISSRLQHSSVGVDYVSSNSELLSHSSGSNLSNPVALQRIPQDLPAAGPGHPSYASSRLRNLSTSSGRRRMDSSSSNSDISVPTASEPMPFASSPSSSVPRLESFDAGRASTAAVSISSGEQYLSGSPTTSEPTPRDSPITSKSTPSSWGPSISRSESFETVGGYYHSSIPSRLQHSSVGADYVSSNPDLLSHSSHSSFIAPDASNPTAVQRMPQDLPAPGYPSYGFSRLRNLSTSSDRRRTDSSSSNPDLPARSDSDILIPSHSSGGPTTTNEPTPQGLPDISAFPPSSGSRSGSLETDRGPPVVDYRDHSSISSGLQHSPVGANYVSSNLSHLSHPPLFTASDSNDSNPVAVQRIPEDLPASGPVYPLYASSRLRNLSTSSGRRRTDSSSSSSDIPIPTASEPTPSSTSSPSSSVPGSESFETGRVRLQHPSVGSTASGGRGMGHVSFDNLPLDSAVGLSNSPLSSQGAPVPHFESFEIGRISTPVVSSRLQHASVNSARPVNADITATSHPHVSRTPQDLSATSRADSFEVGSSTIGLSSRLRNLSTANPDLPAPSDLDISRAKTNEPTPSSFPSSESFETGTPVASDFPATSIIDVGVSARLRHSSTSNGRRLIDPVYSSFGTAPDFNVSRPEQDAHPCPPAKTHPPSLDLTTPLRISKKSPLVEAAPERESISAAIPDTSYSTTSFARRLSRASSDGEVGIGLSLLQDLADGMDDDDSDDEDWSRSSGEIASKRSSADGSVAEDGLVYGDDGDDDEEDPSATPSKASQQSRVVSLDFPMPPSPSFSRFRGAPDRERRPSLAASLAPSAASTSSWEGAADIYDNYRYSRFSMSSGKAPSHRSSQGTSTGMSIGVPPPVPDARHDPRARVNSDASVYTQGSTRDLRHVSTSPPTAPLRPPPLKLVQEHAVWGSPLSSPGRGSPPLSSMGIRGIASAMRQRIEETRQGATPTSPTFSISVPPDDSILSGLGNGIVVEDEDELPSRVLDGVELRDSPASSPEPELELGGLGALVVSNRTPSPMEQEEEEEEEEGDTTASGLEEITHDDDEDATIAILPSTPVTAAAPPLPPSDPGLSSSPQTSHLRPSLRDLREGGTVRVPGTGERRSLFLPHPNAPKAPLTSPGPLYVRQQAPNYPGYGPSPPHLQHNPPGLNQPPYPYPPSQQLRGPRPNFVHVIRQALNMPPPVPRPVIAGRAPLPPRGPTIYGRLETDLAASTGPVPISWSVEPPPTKVARPVTSGEGSTAQVKNGSGAGTSVPTVPARPLEPAKRPSVPSLEETPMQQRDKALEGNVDGVDGKAAGPIPRANFFPKAAGARPRSRSFSDLKSVQGQSGKNSLRSSSSGEIKKSSSFTGSTPAPLSSSPPSSTSSPTPPTPKAVKSSPLRPSPLSLPKNIVTHQSLKPQFSTPALRPPTSPLAQSMIIPVVRSPSPGSVSSLRPASPNTGPGLNIRKLTSAPSSEMVGGSRPLPMSRSTLPSSSSPPTSSNFGLGTSPTASWVGSVGGNASLLEDGGGASSPGSTDSRSGLVVSPVSAGASPVGPMVRQSSLRTKLSLPNLRRNRSKQDDGPASPAVTEGMHQDMLLQVQDMEFELVRPNFSQFSAAARTSQDSAILGKDPYGAGDILLGMASGGSNGAFLRPESPAVSVSSGGHGRSPTIEGGSSNGGGWAPTMTTMTTTTAATAMTSFRAPSPQPPIPESETHMEAHRNRELKWMSLLSASPPSQARKSKKVRKLLLDGVPSSVRYLVWSHLTDGKARCVQGVYAQLCKRGRVPLSEEIEKDVRRGWFEEDGQQQVAGAAEAGGGVVQLLQAYLNMVPDIQYMQGLPHIVGQLLLLAPEEDAFWIFISIMDTHIRPYFSATSTQMEVDAALFCRALEANDAGVAKKLLVDMGISPASICSRWFSSLFVGSLPAEYLTRTWDLFLYDGIPFLIRVGLAIVSFVRRQVLECTSEEAALSLLHRPPVLSLPPTPESYLAFVLSIKLKDDDVRKQRIKMEAQVKRQTQQQQQLRPSNAGGSISLPRS